MKPEQVRERAGVLLAAGLMADEWTASNGVVGDPIKVEHPRGLLHSWFVPVASGGKLAGFLEFAPDLTPLRYSSFQRRPGDLTGCPQAASWTDPPAIQRRARQLARRGELAGEPYLTFDAVPSRLAWAVPLRSPDGAERVVYVTGDYAYEAGPSGGVIG